MITTKQFRELGFTLTSKRCGYFDLPEFKMVLIGEVISLTDKPVKIYDLSKLKLRSLRYLIELERRKAENKRLDDEWKLLHPNNGVDGIFHIRCATPSMPTTFDTIYTITATPVKSRLYFSKPTT